MTKDRFGNKFEALLVVDFGSPNYINGKLLGVQKLHKPSGNAQAEASFELLQIWNSQDAKLTLYHYCAY